jgi:hypothetical protein
MVALATCRGRAQVLRICARLLGARTSDFRQQAVESLIQPNLKVMKKPIFEGPFSWLTTIEEVITAIKQDLVIRSANEVSLADQYLGKL